MAKGTLTLADGTRVDYRRVRTMTQRWARVGASAWVHVPSNPHTTAYRRTMSGARAVVTVVASHYLAVRPFRMNDRCQGERLVIRQRVTGDYSEVVAFAECLPCTRVVASLADRTGVETEATC